MTHARPARDRSRSVRQPAAIRAPGPGRDQRLRHALHSASPGFGLEPIRRYLLRLFPARRKDFVGLPVFIGNATRHSSGLGGKRNVAAICKHLEEALFSSSPERTLGPRLLHRAHAECGGCGVYSVGYACAYMSADTPHACKFLLTYYPISACSLPATRFATDTGHAEEAVIKRA
jgi:hypothetical protein